MSRDAALTENLSGKMMMGMKSAYLWSLTQAD